MKNLIRILLLLIIVGATASIYSSCSEESDCSMTARPMMYCTFKTVNPDDRTSVLNDTIDSLTITALGTDTIIINKEKGVRTLMLPLRYTSDTTAFVFHYDPVRNPNDVDTLYIIQQNSPYFQSMECGYMMKQNIIDAKFGNSASSTEQIDSIKIQYREANAVKKENIQIFFRYRDRMPD